MSEEGTNSKKDQQFMEERIPVLEDEWSNGCSELYSSVFAIYEPWYKQVYGELCSSHFCSFPYDSLESQILEDYISNEFFVNKESIWINQQKTEVERDLVSRLSTDLITYFEYPIEGFPPNNRCPYCDHSLHLIKHQDDEHIGDFLLAGGVEYCINCHYWRFHHLEGRYIGRWSVYAYSYMSLISKMREFENELPQECSGELSQWLRQNPLRWNALNPYQFEKLVADIFNANYQQAEVIHVGKSHDGGVDILFIDTHEKQWLIQVKRRRNIQKGEPVETIRNLLGTMLLEGAYHGIVVSTADHFTYQACKAAQRAEEVGMTVKLIDRGLLDRMLEVILPNVLPWLIDLMTSYIAFPSDSFRKTPEHDYQQLTLWESIDSP